MPLQYTLTFLFALTLSLISTPIARRLAIKLNFMDAPSSPIKTHKEPIPYLGGFAISMSFFFTLILLRFVTDFPSGTLHTLRGIVAGGMIILLIGLADDLGPSRAYYIHYRLKFFFQILAAITLIMFDVRIKFVQPLWLSWTVTIIWVVGITNALNIVDIMDGLASSQAAIASVAFLFISLPTEKIYVNFAAAACAGACIGFIPYNISKKFKIFMGDTGSLSIGFILAALSMGTSYTHMNEIGLLAPILILGIPLYDTVLVSIMRIAKGLSPFEGSKDHLAMKLESLGLKRKTVIWLCALTAGILSFLAFLVTRVAFIPALSIYVVTLVIGTVGIFQLRKVHVD